MTIRKHIICILCKLVASAVLARRFCFGPRWFCFGPRLLQPMGRALGRSLLRVVGMRLRADWSDMKIRAPLPPHHHMGPLHGQLDKIVRKKIHLISTTIAKV